MYFKKSLFVNHSLILFTTNQNIDPQVNINVVLTLEFLVTQMTFLFPVPFTHFLLHGGIEAQKVRI
jgi:hypothetical protein